jgi:hypothetical protein
MFTIRFFTGWIPKNKIPLSVSNRQADRVKAYKTFKLCKKHLKRTTVIARQFIFIFDKSFNSSIGPKLDN